MRLPFLALSALVTAAALTAGCSNVKRPYRTTADPYTPSQVQLADTRMERLLAFGQPNVSRDQAGLLFVSLPVRPATSRSQLVNYRFTFLDETGRELPGGTWQTKKLQSNVVDNIEGNSTSPRAADFRVDIKTAE